MSGERRGVPFDPVVNVAVAIIKPVTRKVSTGMMVVRAKRRDVADAI